MLRMEEWMNIRQMVQEGVPVVQIAGLLGRDRKTVAKAAGNEHAPRYQGGPRSSKLDPYKPFLEVKLGEAPYTAKRLEEMIRAQGYTGGYTILAEHVGALRQKQRVQAVLRFETLPGQQMQADWAEFAWVILPSGERRKLYAFVAILGYSRTRYVEFTLDQKLPRLLECLTHAFAYFGGVPQELLLDNMKTVVLSRDLREGTIRFHPKFSDFIGYYGCACRLTWPYRAQTKGKVERTIGYLRQDFWPGIQFTGLGDLNVQGLGWCDRVNGQPHSQTGQIPWERLKQEGLIPLGDRPAYDTRVHHVRKASRDCWVAFEGSFYSLPWAYAAREVTLLAGTKILEIFCGGDKVAEHPLAQAKGSRVQNPVHWEGFPIPRAASVPVLPVRSLPIRPLEASPAQVELRPAAFYEAFIPAEPAGVSR